MSFAPEGYPFVGVGIFSATLAWAFALYWPEAVAWKIVAGALTGLAVFVLWFFRDPVRVTPADPRAVVAPGEGRVIRIEPAEESSYLLGPAHKISIFLSVFDVHVQRAPVSGVVEQKVYRPGAYLAAWNDKASDDNEQAALGIRTEDGPVLVKQIAGLVARRIVTDPAEGDAVERGKRIGLIRFGSRVDLFVPQAWEVACSVGDRVRVGATVLARRPAGSKEGGTA